LFRRRGRSYSLKAGYTIVVHATRKKVTNEEIMEYLDSLNRSLANLRLDIPIIIKEVLKENNKPRAYIERGYRT
jgi:hypothetical protein